MIAGPPASCPRCATGLSSDRSEGVFAYVRRRSAFSAIFTHRRGVERRSPRVPVLHPGQLPRQVAGGGLLGPGPPPRGPPPGPPPPPAPRGGARARRAAARRPHLHRGRAPPPAARGGGA